MNEKNWYQDATNELQQELSSKSRIDGFEFLTSYFFIQGEAIDGAYDIDSEYSIEVAEFAARENLEAFEHWLKLNCHEWLTIHDGYIWQSTKTVRHLSKKDKHSRLQEVGPALSLTDPPQRSIRTFVILEDELASLVKGSKTERRWQWVVSLGVSILVSVIITILSISQSNTPSVLLYLFVAAFCTTLLGLFAWKQSQDPITELEKKIRGEDNLDVIS